MNKLKLTRPDPVEKNPIKKLTNGYESPIGWWRVTTEGDCEGRTTTQLGEFYGHVAEIAFHLADKNSYTLRFDAIKDRPKGIRITYKATKDKVWISLGIESNTWGMSPESRAKFIDQWLDAKDDIVVKHTCGYATYYAGAYLELR